MKTWLHTAMALAIVLTLMIAAPSVRLTVQVHNWMTRARRRLNFRSQLAWIRSRLALGPRIDCGQLTRIA